MRGTGLPLFDFREDPVCDLTDHFSGQFNPIEVLKLVMDIPGAEASGIKGDHLILNAGDIPLVFGDELRLEFPVAVSGDVNLELSILAFQGFLGMAVPFVRGKGIPFLILFITEGGIEFRFHQLLEDILKTVPEEGIDISNTG